MLPVCERYGMGTLVRSPPAMGLLSGSTVRAARPTHTPHVSTGCVTAAVIGPRTMVHLDDLLAGAATALDDDLLDRTDAIVPPGCGGRAA